jgi:hypothetical protein
VIGAVNRFVDDGGTFMQHERISPVPLVRKAFCDALKAVDVLRMGFAERFFKDRQRLPEDCFGFSSFSPLL